MNHDMDNMDEQFREAAEKYPLNTNSANWKNVMQQLYPSADLSAKQKKKKDFRYLWLLLLLPFGFICGKYGNTDPVISPSHNSKNIESNHTQPKIVEEVATKFPSNTKNTKKDVALSKRRLRVKSEYQKNKNRSNLNSEYNQHHFVSSQKVSAAFHVFTIKSPTNKITHPLKKIHKLNIENKIEDTGRVAFNQSNNFANDDTGILKKITEIQNKSIFPNQIIDSSQQLLVNSTKKAVTKKNKKIFYTGILLGPDFSRVKNQKIKQTGSTIGIIAGLQLTTHLAIETGAWRDKKNYFSAGDYFNTSRIPVPYNSKIITVDGSCIMIEIPLNVRYSFLQKKKREWFVLTGISSYLMKKENYTYLYGRNNVQYNVYKSYTNSSSNWFSILNISAGYQHKFGKALFRVEPYLKMPLKGVGIGQLPISSTGLYMSLIYPLHK